MKSLVLFLLAALPLFTVAQTTDMEPQSGDTHSFPFDHYIDEGCGMYHISGTVTYRVNNHSVARFEGTAKSHFRLPPARSTSQPGRVNLPISPFRIPPAHSTSQPGRVNLPISDFRLPNSHSPAQPRHLPAHPRHLRPLRFAGALFPVALSQILKTSKPKLTP